MCPKIKNAATQIACALSLLFFVALALTNPSSFDIAQGNYEAPDATEGSVLIRIVLKRRISLSQC
jgi:hypothetical protein